MQIWVGTSVLNRLNVGCLFIQVDPFARWQANMKMKIIATDLSPKEGLSEE